MSWVKSELQFKRGTEVKVAAENLKYGEPAFAKDVVDVGGSNVTTVSLHIGDGTTTGGHKFPSLATVQSLIATSAGTTATDSQQGTVLLSDAVDSDANATTGGTAATPAAVKAVKDALDTLSNTVNVFLTGNEDSNETLDRLSELVAAIGANKTTIQALLADKVDKANISDAVDSSSSTNVASSAAVKTAYDAAVTKATNSVFGQVELSDSTESDLAAASGYTAATPAAVKAAMLFAQNCDFGELE